MMIKTSLSRRGTELAAAGGMADLFKAILGDQYDPDTNPDGFVNIGTAENYVMLDECAKFANENLHLSGHEFSYGDGPWGSPRLLKAMTKHINRHFKPHKPLQTENITFANGVTSICEMLGYSIFDPGERVLLSRPIYQAFKMDFGTKATVECEYVSLGEVDQFSLGAVRCYEQAINEAASEGKRIRAMILCHPHNPLGRCYTVEALIGFMKLCQKYGIHLIVDEIYALSVYDVPDPHAVPFTSILSLDTGKYIDKNYLHHLYGFSKDMAAGGLRLGCIHTRNEELMSALKAISQFHWAGGASERIGTMMLEDEKWMDGFLELSRSRLQERNVIVRELLDQHGIGYQKGANAGLFLWIDLRKWCIKPKKADDGGQGQEDDIWAGEDALTKRLVANKVYVTNGKLMSAEEPGWYRLIFSQNKKTVEEGVKRIVGVLKGKDI